jgi:hypothetical protein
VYAAGDALGDLVVNILETPVDDRFQGVELMLRPFFRRVLASALLSVP